MISLFYGADAFARSEAIKALKASIPESVADLNITQLEGRRLKLAEFQSACDAFPLLAETRLVIVEDALKQLRSAEVRDGIQAYLPLLPRSTHLVFSEEDEPDSRLNLVKTLTKLAQVQIFKPLEGAELHAWIAQRATLLGATIEPGAARLLADHVGNNGWMLVTELQKLTAYAKGRAISSADIQLLVVDETESNLFNFIDLLFSRPSPQQRQQAVNRQAELLTTGQAPHYLLFMIARQVRLLLAVQSASGLPANELARALGQRPFVINKAQEQARSISPRLLSDVHDQLVALDHAIKQGQIEAKAALDLLVGMLIFREDAGRAR